MIFMNLSYPYTQMFFPQECRCFGGWGAPSWLFPCNWASPCWKWDAWDKSIAWQCWSLGNWSLPAASGFDMFKTQENRSISWTQMMVSWGDGEIHGDFLRGKDVYDQLTLCGHWNHAASSSNQSWLENGKSMKIPSVRWFSQQTSIHRGYVFRHFFWCSHGVFPIAPGKESAWHHGLQFILLIGLWDFPVPRRRWTGSAVRWDGLG